MNKNKNKNENKIYLNGGAPEDTGEDFEAAAFAALLEDMAGKARFLAEALDILVDMGSDDPDCDCGPAEDMEDMMEMEAEPETDLFLIPGGGFRILVGELYDLFVGYFSLARRLTGAQTEKDFRKIQRSVSRYEGKMKRLCRAWGLPKDGEESWACDTLEECLQKKLLTPAYPFEDYE